MKIAANAPRVLQFGQSQRINNTVDFPFLMTMFTASFIYYLGQLHFSSDFIIIQHNNCESLKKSKFKTLTVLYVTVLRK